MGSKTNNAVEYGPEIGRSLAMKMTNWNGDEMELRTFEGRKMLIFLSLYCSHCVDFLPQLTEIMAGYPMNYLLFTDGDDSDHSEMADYFHWDIPMISMSASAMEKELSISKTPFLIYLSEKNIVLNKGVVDCFPDFEKFLENTKE